MILMTTNNSYLHMTHYQETTSFYDSRHNRITKFYEFERDSFEGTTCFESRLFTFKSEIIDDGCLSVIGD